jgi:TorA maturation chaperone TorD
MTQKIIYTADELEEERVFFELLGRLFYVYPSEVEKIWYKSLIDENIFSEIPFASNQDKTILGRMYLEDWSKNGYTNEKFASLQSDYTRLFIGPGKVLAPPWESVYFNKERLTFQEQTLQVRACYRQFNLEFEDIYKEPDDHIGLEMLFISKLTQMAIELLKDNNQIEFERVLEAKKQFLSEHLLRWGISWCSLVYNHAKTEFYKGLSLITEGGLITLSKKYQVTLFMEIQK